jgi:hypothetical protein
MYDKKYFCRNAYLKDSSGVSRLRGNFKKLQKPLALIVQGFFRGSRLRGNFKTRKYFNEYAFLQYSANHIY